MTQFWSSSSVHDRPLSDVGFAWVKDEELCPTKEKGKSSTHRKLQWKTLNRSTTLDPAAPPWMPCPPILGPQIDPERRVTLGRFSRDACDQSTVRKQQDISVENRRQAPVIGCEWHMKHRPYIWSHVLRFLPIFRAVWGGFGTASRPM